MAVVTLISSPRFTFYLADRCGNATAALALGRLTRQSMRRSGAARWAQGTALASIFLEGPPTESVDPFA
ncbi:hypothetical protein, partial [Streptomyces tremellae]|uniref:hypothetical protein n=1 Tax=Streptomyces tremellae TaxID=1124239 RepID=UPI0031E84118